MQEKLKTNLENFNFDQKLEVFLHENRASIEENYHDANETL